MSTFRTALAGAAARPLAALRRRVADVARPGGTPPALGRAPDAGVWCDVDTDGTVHVYSPKPELGQGAHTVVAQLLLEELGGDPDRVVVHRPDTDRGFPLGWMTVVAGTTAEAMNGPARRAGAALRERLVRARDAPRRRWWPVAGPASALRDRTDHRLVGTSMPRVDLPDKVTGAAEFASDIRLPGMLYGAVTFPPRRGAVLHDAHGLETARALEGVVVVLVDPRTGLVAAAARRTSQAEAALAALRLDWRGGAEVGTDDLRAAMSLGPGGGHVLQDDGDIDAHLSANVADAAAPGVRRVSAEYRTSMALPAPLEPPVAVVDATSSRATVYASTQNPGLVRAQVARALRLRRSGVRVIVPYVGGSFGRKHGYLGDPAADAARLSKAARRPVHLAWTRSQDARHGPKRPPTHHVLDAAMTPAGDVAALRHRVAVGDGSRSWPSTERIARLSDIDLFSVFGAHLLYGRIPHLRTTYRRVPLPVQLGVMRTVGTFANTFAIESFVDELAHAVDADPLQFRLRHLADDNTGRRLRRALEAAAEAADWGAAPRPGHAQGIACCAYGRTVTAQVVDISAAPSLDGPGVHVDRVTAVAEGHQVNPDIARSQNEGGVVMGLSWALGEQVTLERGVVVEDDLDTYPIIRARSAPPVHTVLLDSDHWGGGMNEAVAAPAAAALVNAVHALTGRRIRELPLMPPAIREAFLQVRLL